MALTTSQLKRLGQRLGRMETPDPADLELLAEFERSFDAAQEQVVSTIREQLRIDPSARRKTRRSIVAKIRRQHTALSRMQDIAGCRLVVGDIVEQDEIVGRLCRLPWEKHEVDDRRQRSSHGYRAVHVIVTVEGRPVEIQVRTQLQDMWAQMSEKMADLHGLDVKYGGGSGEVQSFLQEHADAIATIEDLLLRVARLMDGWANTENDVEVQALDVSVRELQANLLKSLRRTIGTLSA